MYPPPVNWPPCAPTTRWSDCNVWNGPLENSLNLKVDSVSSAYVGTLSGIKIKRSNGHPLQWRPLKIWASKPVFFLNWVLNELKVDRSIFFVVHFIFSCFFFIFYFNYIFIYLSILCIIKNIVTEIFPKRSVIFCWICKYTKYTEGWCTFFLYGMDSDWNIPIPNLRTMFSTPFKDCDSKFKIVWSHQCKGSKYNKNHHFFWLSEF